jgi:RimJ/RimL family protein N-acetyltransferase
MLLLRHFMKLSNFCDFEDAMEVRMTEATDWILLKQVRLSALSNAPPAFGMSYETAAKYTDEQWQERASAKAGPEFWLAFMDGEPIGMIGGGISQTHRYNLIGMWVEPRVRGSGIASSLVEVVKSRALQKGHGRVFLDVSSENERAANFYLKHGFVFIDEYEALASHPDITVQTMVWAANDGIESPGMIGQVTSV